MKQKREYIRTCRKCKEWYNTIRKHGNVCKNCTSERWKKRKEKEKREYLKQWQY